MHLRSFRLRPSTLLAAAFAAALALPGLAAAQNGAVQSEVISDAAATRAALKALQISKMRESFRAELRERPKELRERREKMREMARALKKKGANRAKPLEPVTREAGLLPSNAERLQRIAAELAANPFETMTIPANVRANNTAGDPVGACQSEEAIASLGNNVLVAWNDGGAEAQGWGYSTDGGLSFTDGGGVPAPAGMEWISDPVVIVNPTNGKFYFISLYWDPVGQLVNGVGVVGGTFSGPSFTWGTPRKVRETNGTTRAVDKEWGAVDPVTGNLYVSYTLFTAADDSICFHRSTDDNTTWSGSTILNSAASAGLVQGSRPIVGANGEVYVAFYEIGSIDADFVRVAKSTNQGVSFGAPVQAASFFTNYGGGAPGFNRERGIQFPSIAVDRTNGPYRGRVYVTYNESFNYYDDPIVSTGSKVSVENDNFYRRANLFTIGTTLRGTLSSNDVDYFKFGAVQGQNYFFWCDSTIIRPWYTMRIQCGADTTTNLAYAGSPFGPSNTQSLYVWTAPATDTFYVRMAWVTGGTSGNYRVRTSAFATGAEPGRDQRDVMVAWSDNGTTWSTPVRVNDDGPYYDNWLPEVAVGPDGYPYVHWMDWRDHVCGGRSHQYGTRSPNGGVAWVGNQRFTEVQSNWTAALSNLLPNQGDYLHATSDERYVRPTWADARGGTPDVYVARLDTWHTLAGCADDTTVTPGGGATVNVNFTGTNQNPIFSGSFYDSLTCSRAWPMPARTNYNNVPSQSTFGNAYAVAVPDTAAAGTVTICTYVKNTLGLLTQSCCFNVTVNTLVGVENGGALSFALLPASPNPAFGTTKLAFSLPRAGKATLKIYGLQGELVRTLASGDFGAGTHNFSWNGRDDRGHAVAAGTYFYKLESEGRSAVHRLVWMK